MQAKDNSASLSYAAAGVNIDAGNALVERIKPLATATARIGTTDGLGGFGGIFDLKACGYRDPLLISATDGVGTKLKLAEQSGLHETIGIDLVAMCVNDLLVQGAEPLFFLDYFACGTLSVNLAETVVAGIAEGCRQAGCQLIGGETAEMPGMYEAGTYDLAGFAVGAVERDALLPRRDAMQSGDHVLGLRASGLHSNGYSLVRRILTERAVDLHAATPFDAQQSWAECLLTPTRIYIDSCLPVIRQFNSVKGLAHITGGGLLENIPRVLPHGLACRLQRSSWEMPALFQWLAAHGPVEPTEMLRTFNCGIGMVLIVSATESAAIQQALHAAGEECVVIGQLEPRQDQPVIVEA